MVTEDPATLPEALFHHVSELECIHVKGIPSMNHGPSCSLLQPHGRCSAGPVSCQEVDSVSSDEGVWISVELAVLISLQVG